MANSNWRGQVDFPTIPKQDCTWHLIGNKGRIAQSSTGTLDGFFFGKDVSSESSQGFKTCHVFRFCIWNSYRVHKHLWYSGVLPSHCLGFIQTGYHLLQSFWSPERISINKLKKDYLLLVLRFELSNQTIMYKQQVLVGLKCRMKKRYGWEPKNRGWFKGWN